MKRKHFIKGMGLTAAGMLASPYILPSGRLFASSGARKADHVVFCLYAGGVRNFESVQKAEGNLMPNMLIGNESISSDILGAMDTLPNPASVKLQSQGTLFKEFRYNNGPTGHYNGHTVAITGQYTQVDLNLRANPLNPTVFEYYRKHSNIQNTASKSWWISNALGPYPSLNFSSHALYGPNYGANFIQPSSFINTATYPILGNPKSFSVTEKEKINSLRNFLNANFSGNQQLPSAGMTNSRPENEQIQTFIQSLYQQGLQGAFNNILGTSIANGGGFNDLFNIAIAEKVIEEFKPELLVVNMQGVDIGHSNFSEYCNLMRVADYGVMHLWNTIQSTPGMANNTVLIVAPEIGRNLQPNTIIDAYGRYALDHTNDQTSREIFCLVAGPSAVIKQNQVISSVAGESIDIVPTIAHILGFDTDIPAGMLPGRILHEIFV